MTAVAPSVSSVDAVGSFLDRVHFLASRLEGMAERLGRKPSDADVVLPIGRELRKLVEGDLGGLVSGFVPLMKVRAPKANWTRASALAGIDNLSPLPDLSEWRKAQGRRTFIDPRSWTLVQRARSPEGDWVETRMEARAVLAGLDGVASYLVSRREEPPEVLEALLGERALLQRSIWHEQRFDSRDGRRQVALARRRVETFVRHLQKWRQSHRSFLEADRVSMRARSELTGLASKAEKALGAVPRRPWTRRLRRELVEIREDVEATIEAWSSSLPSRSYRKALHGSRVAEVRELGEAIRAYASGEEAVARARSTLEGLHLSGDLFRRERHLIGESASVDELLTQSGMALDLVASAEVVEEIRLLDDKEKPWLSGLLEGERQRRAHRSVAERLAGLRGLGSIAGEVAADWIREELETLKLGPAWRQVETFEERWKGEAWLPDAWVELLPGWRFESRHLDAMALELGRFQAFRYGSRWRGQSLPGPVQSQAIDSLAEKGHFFGQRGSRAQVWEGALLSELQVRGAQLELEYLDPVGLSGPGSLERAKSSELGICLLELHGFAGTPSEKVNEGKRLGLGLLETKAAAISRVDRGSSGPRKLGRGEPLSSTGLGRVSKLILLKVAERDSALGLSVRQALESARVVVRAPTVRPKGVRL